MSAKEEIETLGFKVPDLIEPIVAYRSWVISLNDGVPTLFSHNIQAAWRPGEALKARCHRNNIFHIEHAKYPTKEKHSPAERCSCGIYAAKKNKANSLVPHGHVYGEVYLWGKILEGPRGYRAEYCYPKQFFVTDNSTKRMVERMGFGIPVTLVRRPCSRFPFPVPLHTRIRNLFWSFSSIPVLVCGIWDSFTMDLSKTWNSVLVGGMFGIGVSATTLIILTHRMMRRLHNV